MKKIRLWIHVFPSVLMFAVLLSPPAKAQDTAQASMQSRNGTLSGRVIDEKGEPLIGATVIVEGTAVGELTDIDGAFTLKYGGEGKLIFSMLGYSTEVQPIMAGKSSYLAVLTEKATEMEEVTIVAFSKQKKESVIGSITTTRPSELKTPTSNLTTALGGRIAGIISHQTSGEPGLDNSEFFIRGVTSFNEYARGPLILIDNVELSASDLARLNPDDIASFSIMKDATATALYGARGANGVVLVTTKEGAEGRAKLNIRFENSFSMPTKRIDLVDPISYMRLHNEAYTTRNPLSPRPYTDKKIEATMRGENPYAYPAIDWLDELFKNYTSNQRVNMNVSGGGKVARYYIAASLANDNGLMKVDKRNDFNNNINLKTIQLRSNININLTKTTEFNVRFSGTFEDYKGPIDNGSTLYQKALASNPVLFPKYYPAQGQYATTQHILFGNYGDGNYMNPYADMVKGYKEYSRMALVAQAEIKECLDYITKGLSARALVSTTRSSYFDVNRFYNPFYYKMSYYDPSTGEIDLTNTNPKEGTEYLFYNEGAKLISTSTYIEAAVDYNRTFGEKHAISGLLVFTMRNELHANQGDLQKSLAYRNMGLAGRFTYGYDSRYFVEANFGYNGSERFARHERFGFFPSAGVGWILSNEGFWGQGLKKHLSLLKLKATYGMVGNDQIGSADDRFFYLSNVNMNAASGIQFGENFTTTTPAIGISRYANDRISWETAYKLNLGIEVGLWDKLTVQADYFHEKRTNILMKRESIPSTMGLQADLRANVGEASSHGFEIAVEGSHFFKPDIWITGRANVTYATSKYEVFEEPDYGYPWLSWVGLPIGQPTGLIAERLFVDEADIANSPTQTFGDVMPGDIKYKDINDDGMINSQDCVPIGYPTIPNYVFGFGLSTGIKGFDFSFFFQGATQCSFFIDPRATAPFVDTRQGIFGGRVANNAMMQAWADDYWSESNRNSYAQWPRLAPETVDNNIQRSTWWMRDGAYLRLKSVEIGYTLPKSWTKKAHIEGVRIYFSGLNLLTFSNFKIWDTEMGSNGLNYPIQKVYNVGLNVNF